MKKVAGFCYILLRVLFVASVWIAVVVAAVGCFVEVLELLDKEIVHTAYTYLTSVTGRLGLLPYISAIGMFGCRLLEDYLAQSKPVYIGITQLGAEIAAWLLKYDLIYIGLNVICRLIMMVKSPEALAGISSDLMGVLGFFLADAGLFLLLAVLLTVAHLVCATLYKKKSS